MINGGNATVFVHNMERAVNFYTKALGLKIKYRAGDEWCTIDSGAGFLIGLHPAGEKSPKPGVHGGVSIGFDVRMPLEKVVEELKNRGVKFEGDIFDDDPVRLAFFSDQDGNPLYLCEYKQ